ncbi:hypothetical protein WAI453_009157 [Rhynchosporium graminicola]
MSPTATCCNLTTCHDRDLQGSEDTMKGFASELASETLSGGIYFTVQWKLANALAEPPSTNFAPSYRCSICARDTQG